MKSSFFIFLAFICSASGDKGIGLSGSYGAPPEGHLIIDNLAAGHAGAGGFGPHDCYPQTHYQTHYRTQIRQVPVYKTVVSSQIIEQPVTSVIYETIQKQNTAFVTETEYVTEVDRVTRVNYNPYTTTLDRVLFRPVFVTETVYLTQDQPAVYTATEIVTEFRQVPVEHTQYTTAVVTITDPVTLTHKSEVINERFVTLTQTEFVNQPIAVTETVAGPTIGSPDQRLVLETKKIVSIKPSYLTSTVYQTHYVTTTNIERVPVYVTKTAYDHCKPAAGYSLPKPAAKYSLPKPAVAGGYSYPEPAVAFDIRQSGAAAKSAGSGPIINSASGGPVSLGVLVDSGEVAFGLGLSGAGGPALGGGSLAGIGGPALGGGAAAGIGGPALGGGAGIGGPALGGGGGASVTAGIGGPVLGGGGAAAGFGGPALGGGAGIGGPALGGGGAAVTAGIGGPVLGGGGAAAGVGGPAFGGGAGIGGPVVGGGGGAAAAGVGGPALGGGAGFGGPALGGGGGGSGLGLGIVRVDGVRLDDGDFDGFDLDISAEVVGSSGNLGIFQAEGTRIDSAELDDDVGLGIAGAGILSSSLGSTGSIEDLNDL